MTGRGGKEPAAGFGPPRCRAQSAGANSPARGFLDEMMLLVSIFFIDLFNIAFYLYFEFCFPVSLTFLFIDSGMQRKPVVLRPRRAVGRCRPDGPSDAFLIIF